MSECKSDTKMEKGKEVKNKIKKKIKSIKKIKIKKN